MSVSEWIESIKDGDSVAQKELWQRYYQQLIVSAKRMLQKRGTGPTFDEEDVLQSVFRSLFRRAEQGDFPDLADRDGLWRLLIVMTERRVMNKARDARAKKRGGGVAHLPLYGLNPATGSQLQRDLPAQPKPALGTTEELIQTVEEVLGDCGDLEKEIARLRMEGYEISEIAQRVNRAPSTINRKIKYLKTRLAKDLA